MSDENDWMEEPLSMAEMAQQNKSWKARNDEPAPKLEPVDLHRPSSFAMAGRTEQSKAGPIVFILLVLAALGAVVVSAAIIWFTLVEPSAPPSPQEMDHPGFQGFGDL